MSTTETKSEGRAAIEAVPARERRYPRLSTFEQISSMPKIPYAKGCASAVFVSTEKDDSRYFTQGMCFHEPDMEDFVWDQTRWDEGLFCVKGKLHLHVRDADGNETDIYANEGEHIFVPAGYTYTLKATGVFSLNYWTLSPIHQFGLKFDTDDGPEYHATLKSLRDA
jgi:mannose-6-phosphate isomerase-like protein (cupin superfamily)